MSSFPSSVKFAKCPSQKRAISAPANGNLTEFSIGSMLFAVRRRSRMSRSVQLCALAVVVTLADLAVFVHCMPILCQAWGANPWFMCSLFAAMVIWLNSLANLWRIGTRHLYLSRTSPQASVSLLQLPAPDEGSNPNV
jgi:peptidoglycan/LPS O-acetylase OafA/YrhL